MKWREKLNQYTAEKALEQLLAGNERFVRQTRSYPNQTIARRTEIAAQQKPFAIILGCSDSRVPPEILFDQGLGDLFVVRVAGHVPSESILGSIEYAVEHLGIPLILVLGHKRCGAVEATVKGGEAPAHIRSLMQMIQPAVEKARSRSGDLLDNAIRAHIEGIVTQLKATPPILDEWVKKEKAKIIGAYYDLDNGRVQALAADPNPPRTR